MEEDYHIIENFSPHAAPLSEELADLLSKSKCAPDEFPQAVDPDLILWTGTEFGEECEQLSPLSYDGLPIEDTCAPASLDFRSGDRPAYDSMPELVATFGGKPSGGFADFAPPSQSHIAPDETSPAFDNCTNQSTFESTGLLSGLNSAAQLPSDRRSRCKECRLYFVSGYLLEDHAIRERHATFVCKMPGCEKRYRRRDSLRRHMATHRQSEITCPYCPKRDHMRIFQRKDNLSQHVRTHHPELYHRYKSSISGSSPPKQLRTIPRTVDLISCADLDERSDRCRLPPEELWPIDTTGDTSMIDKSPCTTTEEIASALGDFLGNEDHIVVQIFQRRLDFGNQHKMEQLALSLARLALKEPHDIPDAAREQLEQTSAKCVL